MEAALPAEAGKVPSLVACLSGKHHDGRGSDALPPMHVRLLGGSTVVFYIGFFVEISGFEPEQTEPKSVVLPLHHISVPIYWGAAPNPALRPCCPAGQPCSASASGGVSSFPASTGNLKTQRYKYFLIPVVFNRRFRHFPSGRRQRCCLKKSVIRAAASEARMPAVTSVRGWRSEGRKSV